MTPKPLEGIYIALTSPFAEDDRLAPGKLADNVTAYNAVDLAGYLVLGSTGESVSLSDPESIELVEACVKAAGPGRKILAGTARESTKATVEFTNALAGCGVEAALVRPPSYYKSNLNSEALKTHFLKVADGSRLPIILYNMPQNTGISLDPKLVVELSSHPNIIGLKESSGSLGFLAEVVREVPEDFHYFVGSGHVVYPGLAMGASGAILAVANAVPEMCADIFKHFKAGKTDEARRLQLDLIPINKALTQKTGIAGIKYAQDVRGYFGGPARLPLLPVDAEAKREIAGLLKKLGC